MSEMWKDVWKMIQDSNVLNLLSALLILICGWLIALLVSKGLKKALEKIGLGRKLALCLPEESGKKAASVENVISGISYYILLLLTVLACLTTLRLNAAATPIQNFINVITGYLPRVIAAGLLGFLAWVIATALRYFSLAGMNAFRLDDKIAKHADVKDEDTNLSYTISSVIYWLTFVFFIPPVLNTLQITGITGPLEKMFEKVLNYLPNLIAAAGIAVIGLFLAGIIRKVVTKLLFALNLDALSEKAGVTKLFDQKSLSNMIGIVAYAMVAIPVVIASLSALKIDSLTTSVSRLFDKILGTTGNLFGAAVLIFAAYIAGVFVAGLVTQLLESFGFNKLMTGLGLCREGENEKESISFSAVIGKLTMVAIMYMAFVAALDILELDMLAGVLTLFIPFIGKILIGVIVFLIGIFFSNLAVAAIRAKGFESKILCLATRVAIIFFTGALALQTMGIGGPIVLTAFSCVLGTVAVAVALAFGLGGREYASRKLNEWDDKMSK